MLDVLYTLSVACIAYSLAMLVARGLRFVQRTRFFSQGWKEIHDAT